MGDGAHPFGEECHKIFNAYVHAGGNFIDTANDYTEGTSEKYIGEFITGDRDRFVLATKYTSNTRRDVSIWWMLNVYPEGLNPHVLWLGARAAKGEGPIIE